MGRKRDLEGTEGCRVGPMLCVFNATLSLRFRRSGRKFKEFLDDWLGLELGTSTINRCVHEFGVANKPVVDRLIENVRTTEIGYSRRNPLGSVGALMWM